MKERAYQEEIVEKEPRKRPHLYLVKTRPITDESRFKEAMTSSPH